MNIFDSTIINFFNKFSQQSFVFDNTMTFLADNNLVKGGIFAIVIWWFWFKKSEGEANIREHIISIILSCFIAMILARFLSVLLPYRERPLHEAALNFVLPYGIKPTALTNWSSFPSDHAVLFFTLTTGLLFVSKKLGILAFIYATIFIAFPRIYLGFHYPTDIICGALIGIAIGLIANQPIVCNKICKPILKWSEKMPSPFYALFFLITYQISDLFNSTRQFIHFIIESLEHLI
ncbi:phosphatase PAP2 family protein [Clostridium sp. CF012]|uniref:phosphatase PAP2 family protein n=1 Tax=Clostridium sp. CF012 TaxID=2843319 RepID=UPI001C0BF8F9|nr:phosphatase PAP2 family protein [Clostridium sp. CF012]MBU3146136.1 phosphatase PAP2 family protein [Clostridium sp. CF012]